MSRSRPVSEILCVCSLSSVQLSWPASSTDGPWAPGAAWKLQSEKELTDFFEDKDKLMFDQN